MLEDHDTAVIIGRFVPVHNYHIDTLFVPAIRYKKLLVLIGSATGPRTHKNPFTFEERKDLIQLHLREKGLKGDIHFFPLKDYPYSDDRWVLQVQKIVNENAINQVHLFGSDKDSSSYYLRLFPTWTLHLQNIKAPVGATEIREAYYNDRLESVKHLISYNTAMFLDSCRRSRVHQPIRDEYFYAKNKTAILAFKNEDGTYREAEYDPIAYCVDNVVSWRGQVLLIERKGPAGKGLLALPGGHLNKNEWIVDGALRELKEETSIYFYDSKNALKKLYLDKNWIKKEKVFDNPERSLFGRKITTAFHWVIPDQYGVHTKAGDDASKANWFTFYDVLEKMDNRIFEDHQSIIAHMILGY